MQHDKDIFITQRGGKIQLEPIKAYVKGSYEFPMQPILLNSNIASVQDTYLFDVQEQQVEYQKRLIEVQTKYSKWLLKKSKLVNEFAVEKEKYLEHKVRFSKFIDENRVKMKRSQRLAEDDIKARILIEKESLDLSNHIEIQKLEFANLSTECQSMKELEYILEETLKLDPQSACFTVPNWIGHVESLLFQKDTLQSTIRDMEVTSMNKIEIIEAKGSNDSSINMNYEENGMTNILETNQIASCIESLTSLLKCNPSYLHLIVKDYEKLV